MTRGSDALRKFLSNGSDAKTCKLCEKTFTQSGVANRHYLDVCLKIKAYCVKENCNYWFLSQRALNSHIKKDHKKIVVATCQEPGCLTPHFYTQAEFNRHCHWFCPVCNEEITRDDTTRNHKKLHPETGDSKQPI